MAFQWTEEYSVENTHIDGQHKRLFEIINELFEAMKKKEEIKKIEAIFESLESYGKTHFEDEEKLMQDSNYPDFEEHKKAHAVFFEQIKGLKEKLSLGEKVYAVPIETLIFVRNWLKQHILQTDKLYAPYIK